MVLVISVWSDTQSFTVGKSLSNPVAGKCRAPQGSLPDPIEFIAYTEEVTDLFSAHSVSYRLFADIKQIYFYCSS
jgi:hypothetical protein